MTAPAAPNEPVIWIFSTGTEILQGGSVDRNSPWLSSRLMDLSLPTARHMALPDRREELRAGLALAAAQTDLLIVTGGLGPTGDDLNRPLIAEVWQAPLEENAEALERMRGRFRRRGSEMPESNAVQALVPRGAVILQNLGTAPGFYLRPAAAVTRAAVLALPGPPREMQPMFNEAGAALIAADFCEGRVRPHTLILRTAGVSESRVNEQVADCFERDPLVTFALLAKPGLVDIRMTFMAGDDATNCALEEAWRERVTRLVGREHVYGENAETLEEVVGRLLRGRGEKLAVAESCTGGGLAAALTDVPGSSAYFAEGFVTYTNEAKIGHLGVGAATLEAHGAVSAQVAAQMAAGARRETSAHWGVGITGIAGPEGGSDEKPVGLVWFGLSGPTMERAIERRFLGTRGDIRRQAVLTALNLLRRALLGLPPQA